LEQNNNKKRRRRRENIIGMKEMKGERDSFTCGEGPQFAFLFFILYPIHAHHMYVCIYIYEGSCLSLKDSKYKKGI